MFISFNTGDGSSHKFLTIIGIGGDAFSTAFIFNAINLVEMSVSLLHFFEKYLEIPSLSKFIILSCHSSDFKNISRVPIVESQDDSTYLSIFFKFQSEPDGQKGSAIISGTTYEVRSTIISRDVLGFKGLENLW